MEEPTLLYEDDALVVINKPAGWVAHEGAGETGTTIVDWFVARHPTVASLDWPDPTRPGIVHRLDKDTSGVMVLAKTPAVLADLQHQFKERTTKKTYTALVYGVPKEPEGRIETFIGRNPKRRQEQAVLPLKIGDQTRREAITEYVVEKTFDYQGEPISLITFHPQTGRMHQLRVHAKYMGTPILGDPVYNIKPSRNLSKKLGLNRQLLHASSLVLRHPTTNKPIVFEAPINYLDTLSRASKSLSVS